MSLTLDAKVPERGLEVALQVARGETLALVGPNGAGKSSILSLIAGVLRPAAGVITLEGRPLTAAGLQVPPHDRAVTTLTQDPVLFPHLTVAQNIMFGMQAQGSSRRRARAEASRWMAEIGVSALADRRPSQLSGGQAQRVAIARALAATPRLLLLDEPMAALDIDVAPAVRELLRRVLAERTTILVSHDVLDIVTLADRVAVIEDGRLLESGPTSDVLSRPQEQFTARLAGLNLVSGIWDGRTVEGAIAGQPEHSLPVGTAVRAIIRPSQIGVLEPGATPEVGTTALTRTLTSLEPRGDLVRARAEELSADLSPQQVARLQLHPGDSVRLSIRAEDVSIYPAH